MTAGRSPTSEERREFTQLAYRAHFGVDPAWPELAELWLDAHESRAGQQRRLPPGIRRHLVECGIDPDELGRVYGMGYKLRRWLADQLPREVSSGERLVALEIADRAHETTRLAYGRALPQILQRRTGLMPDSVSKALQRLAKRGLELRVPIGTGKDGRPVYAHEGHQTTYRIPDLIPDLRQRPDGGPASDGDESPGTGPASEAQRPDSHPSEAGPPSEEAGPPSAPSPQEPPQESPQAGGTLPPDPLRPHDPPTSGHGNEIERSTSTGEDQPLGLEGDHRPRAREEPAQLPPALGKRCPHGMPDVARPDGQHCCPACRRNLPAPVPEELPANVVRLHRERAFQ